MKTLGAIGAMVIFLFLSIHAINSGTAGVSNYLGVLVWSFALAYTWTLEQSSSYKAATGFFFLLLLGGAFRGDMLICLGGILLGASLTLWRHEQMKVKQAHNL